MGNDLTLEVNLPGISVSVIDDASQVASAREIFLVNVEDWKLTLAQSREGFHELEAKLARFQVDNFIFDTNHRVLVSKKCSLYCRLVFHFIPLTFISILTLPAVK